MLGLSQCGAMAYDTSLLIIPPLSDLSGIKSLGPYPIKVLPKKGQSTPLSKMFLNGKFLAIYIGYCLWFWDCHICQIRFDLFFQAGDAQEHPDRLASFQPFDFRLSTNIWRYLQDPWVNHHVPYQKLLFWGVPQFQPHHATPQLDEAPRICLRDSVSIPAASQLPSASQPPLAAAPVASKTPRRHMATGNKAWGG